MKISEVLSVENLNKEFICESNGCRAKNVGRQLYFLGNSVGKSEENWEPSYLSHVWIDSDYERIKKDEDNKSN